jgi:AcrR family transcriptional regulator
VPETEVVPTDRRAALKERHRQAIVDAAAELMDTTGGVAFSVDDLAARADVSRRTVFNHFASLDDVVMQVCADILGALVDRFVASASTARVAPAPARAGATTPGHHAGMMFDEVVHALRTTDLVAPMAYLTRTLGVPPHASPARAALLLRSLDHVSERFSAAMLSRHPDADPLDVHLLVNSLVSGVVVLHRHWFARTGGADDEASRRVWTELVERLVVTVRDGYRAPATSP